MAWQNLFRHLHIHTIKLQRMPFFGGVAKLFPNIKKDHLYYCSGQRDSSVMSYVKLHITLQTQKSLCATHINHQVAE